MRNKIIFYTIWLGILSLAPISVLMNTPLSMAFRSGSTITNFTQRLFGLTAFTLLFFQIILGAYMEKWTNKLGGWVFKFHIFEGTLIYFLAFLHPISFMMFNFFLRKGLDPFFIFTDVCVLCSNKLDMYYTLGRISFWLINVSVGAAVLRAANPFMRTNWRKFHILNYLIFLIVGLHGFLLGTDFKFMPYVAFAVPAFLVVLVIIVLKLPSFLKNLSV